MATNIPFHPIADIFPLLDDEPLAALAEDIRAHGLKEPVVLYEDRILDGRNRYRACQQAGVAPQYRTFVGTALEAIAHVWSINMRRRHLTPSQAAIAEVKRAQMQTTYAAQVERWVAEAQQRKEAVLPKDGQQGFQAAPDVSQPIDSHSKSFRSRNTGRTTAKRAAGAGTNRQYIADAEKIISEHPEYVPVIEKGEKTISQVKREIKKAEVQQRLATLPGDKYRVLYADPPWAYGSHSSGLDQYGPAERHYAAMTIAELCALDVQRCVEDNAVLFLWVTSPLLDECWPVIKAWGFEYKTSFVWDKVKHNFGHYNSVRHELLLVCTRGSCTPGVPQLFDSVQTIERSTTHSAKPEEFRQIIDTLYPHGKRLAAVALEAFSGSMTPALYRFRLSFMILSGTAHGVLLHLLG